MDRKAKNKNKTCKWGGKFIWNYLEPIRITFCRKDLFFIIFCIEKQRDYNQRILDILKKAHAGTFQDEDRIFLPEKLKNKSIEELAEEINPWYSLVSEYDFYIKKLSNKTGEFSEEKIIKKYGEKMQKFKMPKQSVGINGIYIDNSK